MHSKNNFKKKFVFYSFFKIWKLHKRKKFHVNKKLGENNVYIRFKSFSGIKNVLCSSNDFQYYFSQPQNYSEDIIIINMFYNTIE